MNKQQSPEWYEGGSGDPLVLVHGFSVSWRIWKPILPLLEKHYRVIAPTLPGHIGGIPMTKRASPLNIAEALAGQLRERGITQAHFVGQSLGGWLVVEMARMGLAKSALGLCSAGAWRNQDDIAKFMNDGRSMLKFLPYVAPLLKLASGPAWMRKLVLAREMEHGERMEAADARDHFDRLTRMTILDEFLDENMAPVQPLPADRKVPLRVVWGACDKILPFEKFGQPLVETLGLPAALILKGCGHNPMFDDPEGVVKAIMDFIREVDAGRVQ